MASLKEEVVARILVVDTDQAVARLVEQILKGNGHQVSVAFSAAAALDAVTVSALAHFSLLVTNYHIMRNGVEGLLTVGVVRHPNLFPRKVIILSACFPADIGSRAALLHTQGFTLICMQKPLNINALEANVASMLADSVLTAG